MPSLRLPEMRQATESFARFGLANYLLVSGNTFSFYLGRSAPYISPIPCSVRIPSRIPAAKADL